MSAPAPTDETADDEAADDEAVDDETADDEAVDDETADDEAVDDAPVVVVTGASAGIGAATARRLATDGTRVVLAARRAERLETVADDCRSAGVETAVVPTDVTDRAAVEALFTAVEERFGRLDGVVVNAGIGEEHTDAVDALPVEQFEAVTETNVHGAFYTTRAALPALREHGGTVVFVGSYKGIYPSTSSPVYAASKWWLRGFAKSVAGQVGPDGVAVTIVNPTGVRTEFGSEFRDRPNAEALDPATTVGVDDVADAIAFALAQDPPTAVAELDLFRRDIHERF
ncbi:SDR family oxidoreductase [Halorubrum sp. SY-15]|uniref:SDR family oxidoreductase n=1 Tax=Halorubrum sp. SY-15 TaxID=3402277 RepID=UPI003EBFCC56